MKIHELKRVVENILNNFGVSQKKRVFFCWGWGKGGVGHSERGGLYTLVMVVSPNFIVIVWMSPTVMDVSTCVTRLGSLA